MMKKDDQQILKDVCYSVFEQLAFMFGEEFDEDELDIEDERFLKAVMGFKGARQGRVIIVVPKQISNLLARNILGIDDDQDIDEDSPVDALKELLNTITGRVVTALFGDEVVVDLTIPETEELDRDRWELLVADDNYLKLSIDETPVLITMQP